MQVLQTLNPSSIMGECDRINICDICPILSHAGMSDARNLHDPIRVQTASTLGFREKRKKNLTPRLGAISFP